MSNLK